MTNDDVKKQVAKILRRACDRADQSALRCDRPTAPADILEAIRTEADLILDPPPKEAAKMQYWLPRFYFDPNRTAETVPLERRDKAPAGDWVEVTITPVEQNAVDWQAAAMRLNNQVAELERVNQELRRRISPVEVAHAPAYNHTRGDSALTPCPKCVPQAAPEPEIWARSEGGGIALSDAKQQTCIPDAPPWLGPDRVQVSVHLVGTVEAMRAAIVETHVKNHPGWSWEYCPQSPCVAARAFDEAHRPRT